ITSGIDGLNRPETEAAMKAAGVGTWRWLLDEQRVALCAQAAALFAASAAELSQAQFIALIHPHERKAMERALQASLYAGTLLDIDFRIAADGKWRRMRGQAANPHVAD